MLRFHDALSNARFLSDYWQKKAVFLKRALPNNWPTLSRHELAWLAMQSDVESRLVFTERKTTGVRYRAEAGPFSLSELSSLPMRDWTLLVHDVEKHVPAMRRLLSTVDFIPDWRIDDIMVSFAAPGGSVGPHRDNYDVFLCQGIGIRNWRFTARNVASDPAASDDLALLQPFDDGHTSDLVRGDVLYVPPGVAHWGTATRACMTYSIGMRAPQFSELQHSTGQIGTSAAEERFYRDPLISATQKQPGLISVREIQHCAKQFGITDAEQLGCRLGQWATETKPWLTPDPLDESDADVLLQEPARLSVHGMTRLAFSESHCFSNGRAIKITPEVGALVAKLCEKRVLPQRDVRDIAKIPILREWLHQLLLLGTFEAPETTPNM